MLISAKEVFICRLLKTVLLFNYALKLCFSQLYQLESFLIFFTNIISIFEAFQVEFQMKHFFILRVVIEAYNGYSIVQLKRKRIYTVIYEDDVAETALVEYTQVLYIKIGIARTDATRSEISSLNQWAIWVKIIYNRICIFLLRSRKDYDLKVLIGGFKTLTSERSDIDAGKYGFRLLRELNWDHDFRIICFYVIDTMDQGFIKVENDCFGLGWVVRFRQVDQ